MLIKKIILPKLPQELIEDVRNTIEVSRNVAFDGQNSRLTDEFGSYYSWYIPSELLQTWCHKNISPDIFFGIQVIAGRMPMHKDFGPTPDSRTELKFNYIIDTGGDNVVTNYYSDDKELIESHILAPGIWYMLNVRVNHDVQNIEIGQQRIAITGRILPS